MKPLTDRDIARLTLWLEEKQDFVFLETSWVNNENRCSYLFLDPVNWLVCEKPEQASSFLEEARNFQLQGYFLAGWFSYEFGYLLEPSLFSLSTDGNGPFAVLGVFQEPIVFDHEADNAQSIKMLTGTVGISEPEYDIHGLRTNITKQEYLQAIDKIKKYLIAGDTYQVNYTLKLCFEFSGSISSFYRALRRNQSVSYGSWIRYGGLDVLSFFPELFFRSDRETITVKPMKGTMARGRTAEEDFPRQEKLRTDLKNISENVMIVDLLRNDLGRLLHGSGGGKVSPRSLFDVDVYETLLQMTSTIDGIRKSPQMPDVRQIMYSLFPCGSVTGAPKIRTMNIIHELEKEPRGVYCGAIGFYNADEAIFNVPIRTVVLKGKKGEMGVGSGIVFDSNPEAEWDESILKGEFLSRPNPSFQLIETLLWEPPSGYWLFEEHLDRLCASAKYFLFSCDRRRIIETLLQEAEMFSQTMRVRLLVGKDGSIEITSAKMDRSQFSGVKQAGGAEPMPVAVFSSQIVDPENIYLYHKTTQRQLFVEERQKAVANGFFEVLFVNIHGEVTEGSVSNIFISGEGQLLTPPVKCGLLAGTFRRHLLEKGDAIERVLRKEDIVNAKEVYIGNSVRGLVRVRVQN